MNKNSSKIVAVGMANCKDEEKTSEIGDFCCTTSYVQFHIFNLRQHVERSKDRLDSISAGNQGIVQIVRYLTFVGRTLTSVEKEFKDKRENRKTLNKNRRRYKAGITENNK